MSCFFLFLDNFIKYAPQYFFFLPMKTLIELRYFQETIPMLLALMQMMDSDEIIYNCLSTLTNIAVFHIWHSELQPAIHVLYATLENPNKKVVLQCLKLLINLSCNDKMIPHLLGGQVCNIYYLD